MKQQQLWRNEPVHMRVCARAHTHTQHAHVAGGEGERGVVAVLRHIVVTISNIVKNVTLRRVELLTGHRCCSPAHASPTQSIFGGGGGVNGKKGVRGCMNGVCTQMM